MDEDKKDEPLTPEEFGIIVKNAQIKEVHVNNEMSMKTILLGVVKDLNRLSPMVTFSAMRQADAARIRNLAKENARLRRIESLIKRLLPYVNHMGDEGESIAAKIRAALAGKPEEEP